MRSALFVQMTRYALVGVVNVGVDVGLLSLSVWLTGVQRGPWLLALASLSFSCAVVNSYVWNGRWTFGARLDPRRQLVPFAAVNVIGLGLNDVVIAALTTVRHPWLGASPVLHVDQAKSVAIVVTAVWNFVALRGYVFRPLRLGPGGQAAAGSEAAREAGGGVRCSVGTEGES